MVTLASVIDGGVVSMTYAALATAESEKPVLTANALNVRFELTLTGPV